MDGQSKNLTAHYLEQIKALFPEVVVEVADAKGEGIHHRIDMEKLAIILGKTSLPDDDSEYSHQYHEKFTFEWAGKRRAIAEAQKRSTGTLCPCKEESRDWDRTENVYIEGDNLEVLKLLQSSYMGRIKMIYIDPPYNTGKDFIYKDNYKDNLANYIDQTNTTSAVNTETSGRYHTNWLNMMYPRLKLARNLLTDDGVIFISIDDNEVDNLKKICNEIFGEENYIGCAGRITKKSNNKGDFWAPNFDYLLTYTQNRNYAKEFTGGVNDSAYNCIEQDGVRKGEKYQLVRLYMSSLQNRNPDQRFWIDCPDGSKIIPPGTTFPPDRPNLGDGIWRWTKKTFNEQRDRIVIKEVRSSNLLDENRNPAKWNVYTKTYLKDVLDNASAKPNNFIETHINQKASHELNELGIPFDYAKPTSLIKYLMDVSHTGNNDVVLDFFSGSASTAHAVMQLNQEDSGNRKFIMIQFPELINAENSKIKEAFKGDYKNICEIGKERIRRAGDKIKSDSPLTTQDLDVGFKVFKLKSSNVKDWDLEIDTADSTDAQNLLFEALHHSVEILKPDRREHDLLYEVMLKLGLKLSENVEERYVDDKKIFIVAHGLMVASFAKNMSYPQIGKMLEFRADFISSAEFKLVIADQSFASDNDKTNALQLFKQKGITNFEII